MKELQLELSSHCNSRCTFCLKGQDTRGFGFMSFDLAKRIIDESRAETLKASWFGESLLNPEFKKIIEYANMKGMRVFLFTNGSLIDFRMAKFLKDKAKVFISIDKVGEKYEQTRVGLKYKDVKRAIKLLPEAILTAVGDGIDVKKEFPDHQVISNKQVDRYKKNTKRDDVNCGHNVNDRLVVGWDGRCYLCCEDWLGKYYIGDLKTQTIDDIWNGHLRISYINNLKDLEICQNCMR